MRECLVVERGEDCIGVGKLLVVTKSGPHPLKVVNVNVVLKIEDVHQRVQRRVRKELPHELALNRRGVNVKLHDDKVLWRRCVLQQMPGIVDVVAT